MLEKELEKGKFIFKPLTLDLQHFADDGGDGGQQAENTQETSNTNEPGDDNPGGQDENTKEQAQTKTEGNVFTQEDVSNIAAREAKKAQEKILKSLGVKDVKSAKEGLQQFKKMQEEQMTESEKALNRAKELETSNIEYQQKVESLNAQIAVLKADVSPDSMEDVVVLAKNHLSDDVDMDKAVEKVLEKYPHFKRQQEQQQEDVQEPKKKPKFSAGEHNSEAKLTTEEEWANAFKM